MTGAAAFTDCASMIPAVGSASRPGHCPPRDPARDQIADRVQQLPVTVALGPSAPPLKPGRHRWQWPNGRPLRIRHVRRIPAHPNGMVGRVAVHVREAITRWSSRVETSVRERVQLRQQGLLVLLGSVRTSELPRGPAFMRRPHCDHPIRLPFDRPTPPIGTWMVSESRLRSLRTAPVPRHRCLALTRAGVLATAYHQGVQLAPSISPGLYRTAQTWKARLAELLVG